MAKNPKKQNKKYKSSNPEYAKGMRDIKFGNAAGVHDDRPNRERSRNDSLRAAIRRSRDESEK